MPSVKADKAIAIQNPFEPRISFPQNIDNELNTEDYLEYFSKLENLLAKRKVNAQSLTLKQTSKPALDALKTYFTSDAELRFKQLILETTSEEDAKALPELLKIAAAKGLPSIQLKATNLSKQTLNNILLVVQANNLAIDIVLPELYDEYQKLIDDETSNFRRKQRIASFDKEQDKTTKKSNILNKRKRNIIVTKKVDSDTEIQAEVAIEKDLEEQIEAEGTTELIDRDKFIELVSSGKLKADKTKYPGYIWDRWFGNINQVVVEPDIISLQTLITTSRDEDPTSEYIYPIIIVQDEPGEEPSQILFRRPGLIDINIDKDNFLKKFYTDQEILNNNFPTKAISFEVLAKWLKYEAELKVKNPDDRWKGEYIVDATKLSVSEEEYKKTILQDCTINFDMPKVCHRFFPNLKVSKLTPAATEALLEYGPLLDFGIDFDHLPAGFELKELKTEGTWILDYSRTKALVKKTDPYALQLPEPETRVSLSTELINLWLDKAETDAEKLLKAHYLSLLTPYNREKAEQFRELLPTMLHLPAENLQTVEQALELALSYHKNLVSSYIGLKDHLLFKFLNNFHENSAISLIENWQKKINFSVADLNRLLAVYTQFGAKGLERLFQVWEKTDASILSSLNNNYFSNCKTYLPYLEPNFDVVEIIIKDFSDEERFIWENLIQQHSATLSQDKLLHLARLFQNFKEQIAKRGLVFPKDPTINSNIKSMPVALSRILTILNATPLRDRPLVWERIFKLDLDSASAIKLITDSVESPIGGFLILPEMQMEPRYYSQYHDYSMNTAQEVFNDPNHGYQSLIINHSKPIWKNDAFDDNSRASNLMFVLGYSKTPEELEKNYYRYLSAKPYRKSLDFYRKAAALIDKNLLNWSWDETKSKVFYAIVASCTSTFEASLVDETDEVALAKLQKLIDTYNRDISTLRNLSNFISPPMPPLDGVRCLFEVIQKVLSQVSGNENWFKEIYIPTYVNVTVFKYRTALFNGMKFYSENALSLDDFAALPDIGDKLISCLGYETDSLIYLMSLFKLNVNSAGKISNFIYLNLDPMPENFKALLESSLKILAQAKTAINSETGLNLSDNDLEKFIENLADSFADNPALDSSVCAINLVEQNFKAHFATDFFDKLRAIELPAEIIALIQSCFPFENQQELVKKLILSFKKPEDIFHRVTVIKAMSRLQSILPEKEQAIFFESIVTINAAKKSRLSDLSELLIAIGDSNSITDFIFLMNHYKEESRSIPRMLCYYKEALKIIYPDRHKFLKISELQVLAANLLEFVDLDNFSLKFKDLIALTETLIENAPNEKQLILASLNSFMNKAEDKHDVLKFAGLLSQLKPYVLRSLSDHYATNPLGLYELLDKVSDKAFDKKDLIFFMVASLENNGQKCELKLIEEFIEKSKTKDLYKLAEQSFKTPPYPSLTKLIDWHTKASDAKEMEKLYLEFQTTPCKREEEKNGFKADKAKDYADKFKGFEFELDDLSNLDKHIQACKTKPIIDLKTRLNELTLDNKIERLAILAELLYRSKGIDEDKAKEIKGNSFELNTVQYLTVLSYLKSEDHITAEMATGEGKSRTMMLAAACLHSQGKTVDFVTSDMQLAQRDHLEYKAFFDLIGAKTALIYSTSSPQSYEKPGINFSDAANLSLFRNRARANHQGEHVIEKDKSKRALLLDEADKTYFDISDTRFNYSDLPKESSIKDMEWIYPILVRFFIQKDPAIFELYKNDIDGCNDAFINFVKLQPEFKEERFTQLQALTLEQLESWQDAAVTAMNLKLGEDYTIEPNVLIETPKGPKLASEARLIYSSRLAPNSKFSFGVHQCLHALLNVELEDKKSKTYLKAKNVMDKQGKPGEPLPFYIDSEKQIVYSSTSKSFLDEYEEGKVWGITGTLGAVIEKEEAAFLYSRNSNNSTNPRGLTTGPMQYIKIPRLNEPKRIDMPIRLTKNTEKRIEAILEYIHEAYLAKRPVLVICENDNEAKLLDEALQKLANRKKLEIPEESWLFVDSMTSSQDEKDKIEKAGNSQAITISTSRLGRGTDIKLSDEAREAGGLRVIGTFLPRERDLNQAFGRAGRYLDDGDARLVVDKEQLSKQFSSKKIKTDFFLSTEFFLKSKQGEVDKEMQLERLLRQCLSDFRIKITDAFFAYYDNISVLSSRKAIDNWSECTKKIDQLWGKTWPDLLELTKQPKLDVAKVKECFERFRAEAQKEWTSLYKSLGEPAEMDKTIAAIDLSPETEHLLRYITPKRLYTVSDRTQVYKTYDKARDGRAVVYDELFMEFKSIWHKEREFFANTKAWIEGAGILFADTRAILTGKRPLFANLRACMAKHLAGKAVTKQISKTILEALDTKNHQSLKKLLREEDARSLLKPLKGDKLLGVKLRLVELILSRMHKIYDNKGELSKRDMVRIHEIFASISESKEADELKAKLAPLKGGFFNKAVRKEISAVVKEESRRPEK